MVMMFLKRLFYCKFSYGERAGLSTQPPHHNEAEEELPPLLITAGASSSVRAPSPICGLPGCFVKVLDDID